MGTLNSTPTNATTKKVTRTSSESGSLLVVVLQSAQVHWKRLTSKSAKPQGENRVRGSGFGGERVVSLSP